MPPKKHDAQLKPNDVIRKHLESAFKFPTVPKPSPHPPEQPKVVPAVVPLTEPANTPLNEAAEVARLLRERLGEKSYRHCFEGKTRWHIVADDLVVGVGSPFLVSWMQKQFRAALSEVARAVMGPGAGVRFEVDGQLAAELHLQSGKASADVTSPDTPIPKASATDKQASGNSAETYRPGRQFARLEDFLTEPAGTLAMTAVQEICQAPGQKYNPLYLHGGVGLGKTHLLEGIYRAIRSRFPALKVLYLTAETFANYFTAALREKTLPGFRQRFRNLNVLLVDDLDFLDNKRGIQEEFLHTFKQLETQGGQLVITADRHPRLLTELSDELSTRCLSGLVCRLEVPEQDTRQRIAAACAQRQKTELSFEVLEFIARRFSRNIRELQGAVNTLATYDRMTKRKLTLSIARGVLADLERDCTRIIRMADVEQTVCQFFGVSPQDLKSAKRLRSLTQPRMLAMFLIRKHTQAAYQEIGQFFGGRNHATVISAEKKVLSWLSEQSSVKIAADTWPIADVLEALERQLQAG